VAGVTLGEGCAEFITTLRDLLERGAAPEDDLTGGKSARLSARVAAVDEEESEERKEEREGEVDGLFESKEREETQESEKPEVPSASHTGSTPSEVVRRCPTR
jgi:hypothetical protein